VRLDREHLFAAVAKERRQIATTNRRLERYPVGDASSPVPGNRIGGNHCTGAPTTFAERTNRLFDTLPLVGPPSAMSITSCANRKTSTISPVSCLASIAGNAKCGRQGGIGNRLEQLAKFAGKTGSFQTLRI
jgi:hypothetical protein